MANQLPRCQIVVEALTRLDEDGAKPLRLNLPVRVGSNRVIRFSIQGQSDKTIPLVYRELGIAPEPPAKLTAGPHLNALVGGKDYELQDNAKYTALIRFDSGAGVVSRASFLIEVGQYEEIEMTGPIDLITMREAPSDPEPSPPSAAT